MYYRTADTELAQALHLIIERIGSIACPRSASRSPAKKESVHHSCRGRDPVQEETIRKIHDLMTGNLQKRYTIEELSKKFLINTSALKSTFKAVYGLPIAAYMKKYRIDQAAVLLLETSDTIASVAMLVGYESQSKFTAAFKEIMKMLPTDYRRQHT